MSPSPPDLLLYYHPHSFYSQKVVMALHQKKLKFRTSLVDIYKGKQYTDSFLYLSPRGEIPVLVDDSTRIIVDSKQILDYIEDNFSNGSPRLHPEDLIGGQRCDQLVNMIHSLKVEALCLGSVMFDDLAISPKAPYDNDKYRAQIKQAMQNRLATLRSIRSDESLKQKLVDIENDLKIWRNRENFESLLLNFERVLDEVEAELSAHDDHNWWLCSPEVSLADVSLGILLHRLWQLGFERRMFERNRPCIQRYFTRVQRLESYKKATSMSVSFSIFDLFNNPYFLGLLGTSALVGTGYYLWQKSNKLRVLNWFNKSGGKEMIKRGGQVITYPILPIPEPAKPELFF